MKKVIRFITALATTAVILASCSAEPILNSPIPKQYLPELPEGGKEMIDADIVKSTITSTDDGNGNYTNPVIFADVPDIDFIRVDDAYYMVSTTMHLSPGCPVMKSYDLVNWEIVNYVYNTLDDADNLALRNGKHNYGQGQWAATIRHNNGIFYVGFLSYATGKTYIYYTKDIENGKWERFEFDKGFHDMSLLFDDDGKVYLIYGGGQIRCIELEEDLSAVKPETDRIIIKDAGLVSGCLAEGAHAYKINGYYYIFIITWPPNQRRTQLCYRSKSLDGEWEMKIILDDNIDFRNDGVAQGGIIDDADGNWYCLLFQDHGAVGRAPVLMPMIWEDDWPVVGVDGKAPKTAKIPFAKQELKSIVTSDEFINSQIVRPYHSFAESLEEAGENDYNGSNLALEWQWNHNPDNRLWSLTEREGYLRLKTGSVCNTVTEARNTLTQRTFGPECSAYIKLDTAGMKEGDISGLSAFAEKYGYVGVKIENGKKYIISVWYNDNDSVEKEFETERVEITENEVYLRVDCDYINAADKAYFYYSLDGENWTKIGNVLHMNYYGLHFMGYRYAIFNFSTKTPGGYADVDFFRVDNKIIR
ncbi:MAG: glycosyl hydrolase 43 family protein [Ruminiclostridium sp.]|nr:glycosyl hydrolase 43 family protein [Ruminiclostridium sp.]